MRNFILASLIGFGMLATAAKADNAKPTELSITTNAFLDSSTTPVLYTCDGKDIPPELSWSNAPAKTQSFALIFSDVDAPNGAWYHWVVYNIPKSAAKFEEGISKMPAGTLIGKNSWNNARYNGPCPPKGTTHTYIFTLYALDKKLPLPAGATAKDVIIAMHNHIVQQATLTTVFSRWLV